jgi:hypothetical protein
LYARSCACSWPRCCGQGRRPLHVNRHRADPHSHEALPSWWAPSPSPPSPSPPQPLPASRRRPGRCAGGRSTHTVRPSSGGNPTVQTRALSSCVSGRCAGPAPAWPPLLAGAAAPQLTGSSPLHNTAWLAGTLPTHAGAAHATAGGSRMNARAKGQGPARGSVRAKVGQAAGIGGAARGRAGGPRGLFSSLCSVRQRLTQAVFAVRAVRRGQRWHRVPHARACASYLSIVATIATYD